MGISGETETAASGISKKRPQECSCELNQATAVLWYPAIIVGNSANPAQCRKNGRRAALGMEKSKQRPLFASSAVARARTSAGMSSGAPDKEPLENRESTSNLSYSRNSRRKKRQQKKSDKPAGERGDLPGPEVDIEDLVPAEPLKSVFLSRRLQRRVNVGSNASSTALGHRSENAWGLASCSRNMAENAVDAVLSRSLV